MSASPEQGGSTPIELEWSSHRLNLRNPTEDWTGVTDPAERRKLQNRLNQRARRNRAQKKVSRVGQHAPPLKASKGAKHGEVADEGSRSASDSTQSSPASVTTVATPGCIGASPRVQELMRRFAAHAYTSYMQGTPALSHLSLLIKFNVSSALARNAEILGVKAEYYDWNGISPFNKQGPMLGLMSPEKDTQWPESLQPTELQTSIEHHPWVDLFPWPKFRNNLLQAFEHPEICDEDELCHDVCEYSNEDGQPILIVWGSAWDPRSWEVSDHFLKKWGWLLYGCSEMIQATNYWREKRGEKRLTLEEVQGAIRSSMPSQLRNTAL